MPKLSIRKSVVIQQPPEMAFAQVRNFRSWVHWSPWLIAEPACKVAYADDGRSYAWDGRIVGTGDITVTSEAAPRAIHYRLTFQKPWKSESKVSFLFAARDGGVEATWTMDGSLPFFLFWMKSMMTAFLGMDYQRGLSMLKDHLETGAVPSKLEFLGRQVHPGSSYVGVKRSCAIAAIASSMGADFRRLQESLGRGGQQPADKPFAIYHHWDAVKGRAEYTLAFPVTNPPATPDSGFVTGHLPTCTVYSVKHTGPYRHLGNPWAAGMMHARAKVFAQDKAIDPFETYENNPQDVSENALVTIVHFPAK